MDLQTLVQALIATLQFFLSMISEEEQEQQIMPSLNITTNNTTTFSGFRCPLDFSGANCTDECGLTYGATPNVKIVGGSVAVAHSWPSAVKLEISYTGYFEPDGPDSLFLREFAYSCGGTLISANTVLTAAHCVLTQVQAYSYQSMSTLQIPVWSNPTNPTNGSIYTTYLGLQDYTDLESSMASGIAVKHSVLEVFRHENYNENIVHNDIALFRLTTAAKLNSYIQLACLPSRYRTESTIGDLDVYPPSGSDAFAVGWGLTAEDGITSSELRNVKLSIYEAETECRSVRPDIPKDWTTQICAGDLAGGKDTCQGDSGGPLYVKESENSTSFRVFGLVSWGDGCAQPNSPGIYTRVSAYLEWIESIENGTRTTVLL